ncbi:MAG TPA: glutamine synthetase family protein [Acidimicrobiales bacterium]|nr:glutamine synthetase family protein [Acidimicrobiales bacterium]
MISLGDLRTKVESGDIDTVVVGFTDHYGRLCGKRFDAGFFLESTAADGTHACDYLLTTDMEMEPIPGYGFASWQQGYGDVHLVPDLSTLRLASWLDATALVLCDVEHAAVAPRSILRAQVDAAAALGLTAKAATELEHYLFETSYRDVARGTAPEPAGWYLEDYQLLQGARTERFHQEARRHLNRSGVPVENSKGEWGLGQHEVNVRYADILEMADRHVVFKQCLKELADRSGLSVTFMAKPFGDRAGSSCHVHVSLWRDDANAFAADGNDLSSFVGGVLQHVPDVMLFFAPTVNSYKRYVDGSWAPTRLAWSEDNRTAGVRLVGHGAARRVECRIPGADCNPYLALAALLAAGLDGIRNETQPPPRFTGDVYAATELPHVPRTLREATDLFEASAFTRAAFGDDVVDHYTHYARTEQAQFDAAVTDWERHRYFERI